MIFFKRGKQKVLKKPKQWKIRRQCLELILEAAKSNHPREFGGLLRVEPKKKNIIYELVLLPGTISGDSHAIFKLHMLPVDFTVIGTVHSHPSPSCFPSEADRVLFQKFGSIHIIVAEPYNNNSWKAYNKNGEEINIDTI